MEPFKFDRNVFSVIKMSESDAMDLDYWLSRPPIERLAALEYNRQIAYNYDPHTARIPRVLEIVKRKRG